MFLRITILTKCYYIIYIFSLFSFNVVCCITEEPENHPHRLAIKVVADRNHSYSARRRSSLAEIDNEAEEEPQTKVKDGEGWPKVKDVEGWPKVKDVEGWPKVKDVEGWPRAKFHLPHSDSSDSEEGISFTVTAPQDSKIEQSLRRKLIRLNSHSTAR